MVTHEKRVQLYERRKGLVQLYFRKQLTWQTARLLASEFGVSTGTLLRDWSNRYRWLHMFTKNDSEDP